MNKLKAEKYGELLQEIARVMAKKNIKIELLHEEINRLKQLLLNAEKEKG